MVQMPDMFLDRVDKLQYRDLVNLMEFPFFAVSKYPVHEVRVYDDGKVRIEVKPGHGGLATIWDKDILIYVASQINAKLNEGSEVSPKVRFHANDFFKSCGRSSGGRAYEDLIAALDRLQSTSVRTNITSKSNGVVERSFFSWIKSGRMIERRLPNGRTVLGMVEVEIEDWIWRQIVEDRSILSIDQSYFNLNSGVARRLYEIARKHCGQKTSWSMGLDKLSNKLGYSLEDSRNFKRFLGAVVESNDLPEYTIHISLMGDPADEPVQMKAHRGIKNLKVVFRRRSKTYQLSHDPEVAFRASNDREASKADVANTAADIGANAEAPPAEGDDQVPLEDIRSLLRGMEERSRMGWPTKGARA